MSINEVSVTLVIWALFDFISVAGMKHSDKKKSNLVEKVFVLAHNSRLQFTSARESR